MGFFFFCADRFSGLCGKVFPVVSRTSTAHSVMGRTTHNYKLFLGVSFYSYICNVIFEESNKSIESRIKQTKNGTEKSCRQKTSLQVLDILASINSYITSSGFFMTVYSKNRTARKSPVFFQYLTAEL